MNKFILLKRTYPVSQCDRLCDGYDYIMKHSTPEERKEWGIVDNELERTIKEGEKYIYQVAKEGKELKIMCLCFDNYAIVRKHIYGIDDD
jgi:hypothetical protein